MMEEEFYSTIKLNSGEELVAKVCYLKEEDSLLVESPMLVENHRQRKNGKYVEGFTLKEWIHSSYDSIYVIKMQSILTMTELDDRIKEFYLHTINNENPLDMGTYGINIKPKDFSRRMGYLGSVNDTKKFLEEIYKKC